jgi:hypothetical protein
MAEKLKTLVLDLDGKPVTITVIRSTTRTGIKRSLLIFDAFQKKEEKEKAGDPVDEVMHILSYRTLPDLISGTESASGMKFPITIEDLMELPEQFVSEWVTAIYEVNPHWNPANMPATKEIEAEEQEKKTKP